MALYSKLFASHAKVEAAASRQETPLPNGGTEIPSDSSAGSAATDGKAMMQEALDNARKNIKPGETSRLAAAEKAQSVSNKDAFREMYAKELKNNSRLLLEGLTALQQSSRFKFKVPDHSDGSGTLRIDTNIVWMDPANTGQQEYSGSIEVMNSPSRIFVFLGGPENGKEYRLRQYCEGNNGEKFPLDNYPDVESVTKKILQCVADRAVDAGLVDCTQQTQPQHQSTATIRAAPSKPPGGFKP
jgi:hypothetical protein